MKKPLVVLLAALALGGGATAFVLLRGPGPAELLATGIPPRPADAPIVPALAERLANAEQDIRTRADVAAMAELSRLYHANGFFAEASQCYAVLMELEPRKALWPHLSAAIFAGYGRLEEAIPLYQAAVKLDPKYIVARIRLGDVLLKANRLEEALAAYEGALTLEARNPYALVGVARVEMARNEWDSARIHLEQATEASNWSLGYDHLVDAYERTGRAALARSLRSRQKASGAYYDIPDPWHDAMFIDCYDPYRATLAAGSAMRAGDLDTAVKLLEHVNRIAPKYALAYYHLGQYQTMQGKPRLAILSYEKAGELDPLYSDTWVKLIQLQSELGDELGANMTLDKGLKLCPHSPSMHGFRAQRHAAAGRLREAEADFRRVIELRVDESSGYLAYAKFLFALNRVDDGVATLNQGLAIEPEDPGIMAILAFHAISTADKAKARGWMTRLKAQPRTPAGVLQNLTEKFRQAFGTAP